MALKRYRPAGEEKKMSGDKYVVTGWTVAKRKKYSENGRDPCLKKMMDNIKKGMIMARAELFECLNPTENL
ncbi:hypothetical protein N7533_003484 [Penicillium manginii]|jgi:hypothetical protein|uniref:uncharacterized protein n=1 Tax=Penicillium manginii TaxID=203109 RepID=UPI002548AFBC|nr:uncharacterized protein N7533_003484 [Penicillium manginii]KAJ5761445.1 hypothetical protein N7533_003484 [Penicillium manginii]